MDKEQFNYHPLEIAEVFYQEPKDQSYSHMKHQVITFLSTLIRTLTKRHPEYTFIGVAASNRNEEFSWYHFRVYKGKTHLGSIYQGFNNGDHTFCIESPTTIKASNRRTKRHTETKDIKKAAKLFSQHMVPESDTARLDKAKVNLNGIVANRTVDMERRVIQHRNHLWGFVMEIMVAEWETFAPKLLAAGASSEVVSNFVEVRENYQKGQLLSAYMARNRGAHIILEEDGSYLVGMNNPVVHVGRMTHDQLTPVMRTNLGMLKLCEDGKMVLGVGARHSPTTFFVVTEEEGPQ